MTGPRPAHLVLLVGGFVVSMVILLFALHQLKHLGLGTPLPAAITTPAPTTGTGGVLTTPVPVPRVHHHGGGFSFWRLLLWLFLASTVVGLIIGGRWTIRVVRERLDNRLTREYGLYELRLSLHDEAREQEIVEMVESLLHAVREFPEQRGREGQPFMAIEAHYGPGASGELEWLLCVRCEKTLAATIDGIIAAAYPSVRLGYEFTGPPEEIDGRLPVPGHVLRFRKSRDFIFPLAGEVQAGAARPLEAIAQAQAAIGVPSTVRFQMTPCALTVERYARSRLRSHEDALADTGRSQLASSEMTAAAASQNHAWCWFEVQVATDSRENANRIAAAVLARRGANRLQRRWMIVRQDKYRRRFPTAYPPLLPSPTLRTLTSSSEIARLLALPGARLKNVPVRRLPLPRIPAPPEVCTAIDDPQPQMPPDPRGP